MPLVQHRASLPVVVLLCRGESRQQCDALSREKRQFSPSIRDYGDAGVSLGMAGCGSLLTLAQDQKLKSGLQKSTLKSFQS